MPSAIHGVPYINRAPLFFCSAGDKNNCSESLKQSFSTGSNPQDDAAGKCRTCGTVYPSNNKLHDHLRAVEEHQKALAKLESQSNTTWLQGKNLRVKILPGQNFPSGVEQILKATLESWMAGINDNLTLQWVGSYDEADIRISFRNDEPNWCALGARAVFYDRNMATMNFSLGGWKEKLIVFPYSTIARAAAHLFGHALGL